MASIHPACNELKHAYDKCFNEWYTNTFLMGGPDAPAAPSAGTRSPNSPHGSSGDKDPLESACGHAFQLYQACIGVCAACHASRMHTFMHLSLNYEDVTRGMQKVIQEKGIDVMVREARDAEELASSSSSA
jgi:hypothetical protein